MQIRSTGCSRAAEPVKLKLRLTCKRAREVESANVVGELLGRESPKRSCSSARTLDSWDLGAGANRRRRGLRDRCSRTARLLTSLGIQPRRTVRVVLYMNEENGLSGARAYAEAHKAELKEPRWRPWEADAGSGAAARIWRGRRAGVGGAGA